MKPLWKSKKEPLELVIPWISSNSTLSQPKRHSSLGIGHPSDRFLASDVLFWDGRWVVPWQLGVGTFSSSFVFDRGYPFSMVCLESISWSGPSDVFRVRLDQPPILWEPDRRWIPVVPIRVGWFCCHEGCPQKHRSPWWSWFGLLSRSSRLDDQIHPFDEPCLWPCKPWMASTLFWSNRCWSITRWYRSNASWYGLRCREGRFRFHSRTGRPAKVFRLEVAFWARRGCFPFKVWHTSSLEALASVCLCWIFSFLAILWH